MKKPKAVPFTDVKTFKNKKRAKNRPKSLITTRLEAVRTIVIPAWEIWAAKNEREKFDKLKAARCEVEAIEREIMFAYYYKR